MLKRIAIILAVLAGSLVAFGVTASASNASAPNCTGYVSYTTLGSVVVPSGNYCEINSSTVTGSITVKPNASLVMCNDLVKGSINATQAYVNIDNNTEVDGSITLNKPGIPFIPSGLCGERGSYSATSYVCPNYIGGNLNIQNGPWNYLSLEVGDCGWVDIHGSFTISGNRQLVEAGYFNVDGSLVCLNNHPAPEFFYPFYVSGQIVGCNVEVGPPG